MTTADKLAAALRSIVSMHSRSNWQAARTALAEYDDAQRDPVRALILRDALRDYASAQYVTARDLRDDSKRHEWDKTTRERFAQGADVRRRVALEMVEEMGV